MARNKKSSKNPVEFDRVRVEALKFAREFQAGHAAIGGLAIYLHGVARVTATNLTNDGDFMLSVQDFEALQATDEVVASRTESKHQVIRNAVPIDVYVEGRNDLSVPFVQVLEHAVFIDGVRVACLEHLLALKLEAYRTRKASAKGPKDARDIATICWLTHEGPGFDVSLAGPFVSQTHLALLEEIASQQDRAVHDAIASIQRSLKKRGKLMALSRFSRGELQVRDAMDVIGVRTHKELYAATLEAGLDLPRASDATVRLETAAVSDLIAGPQGTGDLDAERARLQVQETMLAQLRATWLAHPQLRLGGLLARLLGISTGPLHFVADEALTRSLANVERGAVGADAKLDEQVQDSKLAELAKLKSELGVYASKRSGRFYVAGVGLLGRLTVLDGDVDVLTDFANEDAAAKAMEAADELCRRHHLAVGVDGPASWFKRERLDRYPECWVPEARHESDGGPLSDSGHAKVDRRTVLEAYSSGRRARQKTIDRLGLENYGQLLDALDAEGIPRPQVQEPEFSRMQAEVVDVLGEAMPKRDPPKTRQKARERSLLLDFTAGRTSKSETMRALGITTVQELRQRMAKHGVAPRHLPRARVEEMATSVERALSKTKAKRRTRKKAKRP